MSDVLVDSLILLSFALSFTQEADADIGRPSGYERCRDQMGSAFVRMMW